MTAGDVSRALDGVRAAADDPERAHALEDELWRQVLAFIADESAAPRSCVELAEMALTSRDIVFRRWRS